MSQRQRLGLTAAPVLYVGLALFSCSFAKNLDVPYEPTPGAIVATMLNLAEAKPTDILYDLGSGDGRIVVTALRDFGVRKGVGVDIDPERIGESRANAQKAGVSDRATFVEGNLFQFDFREATVLTMYLLPHVNIQLRPRVLDLKPGTRVVSHRFDMGDWEADRTAKVGTRDIYLWIVPAKVGGRWEWNANGQSYRLDLRQEYQKVSGTLHAGRRAVPLEKALLNGDRLRFEARNGEGVLRFDGKVAGNAIQAAVDGADGIQVRRIE